MKRFARFCFMIVLAALVVFGPALSTFAQGGGAINCNGLSEEDCQIIQDSMVAMRGISSFSVPTWEFELQIEAGEERMEFAGNGTAMLMLPPEVVAMLSDLPAAADPFDMGPALAILERLDAEFVQAALAGTLLQIAVNDLTLDAPDQSQSFNAEFILKDNGVYLHVPSPTGVDQWFGQKIEWTNADLNELEQGLEEMQAALQDPEFAEAMENMEAMSASLEGLYGVINQYVVTTRGENQTVNGQDMAVFTTTFDLAGLLASPELPGAIITFLNDPAMSEAFAGTDVSTVTETQVQFVLMTAGLVLEESSFTMEQWIGLDDLFIHKSQGSMALTVDVGSLAGESAEPQSFAISGSFNIELDQFNAVTPDAVTIPENYLALEDTSNFMVGTPDMIRQALTIGEPVTASFTTDENQHVYSVNLPADSAVEVLLESEGYPYMKVYDPDGFLVEEYDAYFDDSLIFTAEEDGLYLVVVNSYWEEEYTLTVQLRE